MHVNRIFLALATISCLLCGPAYGHAMLESSSPANHAVLSAAPKSIDLKFAHPTKLVSLKLLKGSDQITLGTALPTDPASAFSIPLPSLTPGQYQATWSSIATDGHAMKGSLLFTVQGN